MATSCSSELVSHWLHLLLLHIEASLLIPGASPEGDGAGDLVNRSVLCLGDEEEDEDDGADEDEDEKEIRVGLEPVLVKGRRGRE